MTDCVPEPTYGRVLELKEVHSFTEYHDSLEQYYGKIAKSYAEFTIRYYGSATVVFDGHEEESRIREEDTIFIQLSASLLIHIYHAIKKCPCQDMHVQTETDANARYVMD